MQGPWEGRDTGWRQGYKEAAVRGQAIVASCAEQAAVADSPRPDRE